jgi:hypothetical protein
MDCRAFLGISQALGLQDRSLNETNCCSYNTTQVQCDDQNRIWFLRFRRTGFSGYIPNNIDSLQSLQVLSLVGNKYTGRIPESLGNIRTLTTLWLRDNDFEGEIPTSITTLPMLINFDIADTYIKGPIPDTLLQRSLNSSIIDGCPYDTNQCGDQPNKPSNPGCREVCTPPPPEVSTTSVAQEQTSSSPNLALILPLSILGALLLITLVAVGFLYYRKKTTHSFRSFPRNDSVKKPIVNQESDAASVESYNVAQRAPQSILVLPTLDPTLAVPEQALGSDPNAVQAYAIYYPVIQDGQTVLYPTMDPESLTYSEVQQQIPDPPMSMAPETIPSPSANRITSKDLDIQEEIPPEFAHLYPPKKQPSFFEKLFEGLK